MGHVIGPVRRPTDQHRSDCPFTLCNCLGMSTRKLLFSLGKQQALTEDNLPPSVFAVSWL